MQLSIGIGPLAQAILLQKPIQLLWCCIPLLRTERNLRIEELTLKEMCATEGLILILTTHRDLGCGCTGLAIREESRSTIAAAGAEGCKLLIGVSVGNEIEKLPEGAALGIAVQAHTDDMLSVCLYCGQDKGGQISEELGLLNDNTLRGVKLRMLEKGYELANGHRRMRLLVVADNLGLLGIALVEGTRYTECATVNHFVAADNAENGGRLASKHRAEKELKRHLEVLR